MSTPTLSTGVKNFIITTSNYIVPTMIIFSSILAFFLYPRTYLNSQLEQSCMAGFPPKGEAQILRDLPAIKNMADPIRLDQDPDPSIGGPDPVVKSDFVLIRTDVPISDHGNTPGWTILGGQSRVDNQHTINTDNLPQKPRPGYSMFYPAEWGEMDVPGKGTLYLRGQGILFFVNNDPATVVYADGLPIHFADVYQDVRIFNSPTKPYQTEELFVCKHSLLNNRNIVVIPPQNSSPNNEQLQLEWFAFQRTGIWALHCKPAIYLYPPEKMMVNVKVTPSGFLTYTDPQYDDKTGWNVEAYPDGKLVQADQRISGSADQYPYLYFESKIRDEIIKKPTNGWVVKYSELDSLYQDILPKLGLNKQQTKDFTDYWNKALDKTSPYYFVGMIDQDNVDQIEKLEITPKPDLINRVRIYFERLDQPKIVEAPALTYPLPLSPSRFNVVEWGGMVKNDPTHPFTCSQ